MTLLVAATNHRSVLDLTPEILVLDIGAETNMTGDSDVSGIDIF